MADTTVYTVSAGYLPYLANAMSDFKVSQKLVSGSKREGVEGKAAKWDGVQLKGKEAIMPDGTLRKAKVRGGIGWFEYSRNIKELHQKTTQNMLNDKLKEMAATFYSRKQESMSEELLNSFISTGNLGDISPTGVMVDEGEGTPEERFKGENDDGFDVESIGELDTDLIGYAQTVDMYIRDADDNIYRLDVTAMTFDTKTAHHGLSSYEDRVEKKVTGQHLQKEIEASGHGQGSPAQQRLWNYFKGLQSGWNNQIQALKDRIDNFGDDNTREQLSALTQGRTTLHKLGEKFRASLTDIRGGAKGEAAAKIDPDIGAYRDRLRVTDRKTGKRRWDKRFKKYKRKTSHLITAQTAEQGAREGWSSGLSFVLHALGNMLEIAAEKTGNHGGKEYGYSTGYSLGEGLAGDFVVEVMHRINTKGASVLLFKDLRSQDVIIHNEAHLIHAYRNKLLDLEREVSQAHHEQEAIRTNSSFAGSLIREEGVALEIGGTTTASLLQIADKSAPKLKYAAVIAPTRVNNDINAFINTLHGNPDKLRKLMDTKGKIVNLTETDPTFKRLLQQQKQREDITQLAGSTNWAATARLGAIQKQLWKQKAVPDFWAAPYLTLMYPSIQMRVRGE